MTISDIIAALRYQIFTPDVTTMGPCRMAGCRNSARGGSICADCYAIRLIANGARERDVATMVMVWREAVQAKRKGDAIADAIMKQAG